MLDDLAGVIETLQGRIRNYGDTLRQNEIRTRVALIDPLLQALGWDVADPALATPEYEISGQRVDYALLGPEGKPAATVEAKKLGEPLASHRMQMLNYSNAAGIAYAGLTDGDRWEMYDVFKPVPLENKNLLQVSLSGEPAYHCALHLLLLWRSNLASGQPVAANEPIAGFPLTPGDDTSQPPVDVSQLQGWVRLADFQPKPKDSHPTAIRLAKGYERSCQFWWSIIAEVADWLVRTGKLTAAQCPVKIPKGQRYIVHTEPVHINGKDFEHPYALPNSLYLERFYKVPLAVEMPKALLQHCGVDAGQVWLKLG